MPTCPPRPAVFINVVLSTVDMLKLGKAGKVVSYTVGFYMFTTLVAALVGVFTVICYKGFFIDVSSDIGEAEESDLEQVSLSDTIYDGVFIKLISKNIFADFVSSNFASIIFFAVVFAFAVQKATTHLHLTNQSTASHVVDLFRELEQAGGGHSSGQSRIVRRDHHRRHQHQEALPPLLTARPPLADSARDDQLDPHHHSHRRLLPRCQCRREAR